MDHTLRSWQPVIARLYRLGAFGIVAAVAFLAGVGLSTYSSRVASLLVTIHQVPSHTIGAPVTANSASLPAGLAVQQGVDTMALSTEQARMQALQVRAAAAMAERAAQAEPRGGSMALAVEQTHTQALQRSIAAAYAARLAQQP